MFKKFISTDNKMILKDSFFHRRMQNFIANLLFPVGKGNWYTLKGYGKNANGSVLDSPFDNFVQAQKIEENSQYHGQFKDLDFKLEHVKSSLADGSGCEIELMHCTPEDVVFMGNPLGDKNTKPQVGKGKHIVYFPGANTYYQACFRDITAAAKETGATIHAFNFPGTGSGTGKVKEAKDLVNAGIAVVNSLLAKGIHPDDIILQGDCYGAAIAYSVKKEFKSQSDIDLRIIMNNSFKSFKAAVCDMISSSRWLPSKLKSIVKQLLVYTGWHVTPGKDYKLAGPYQAHIQHLGDQTLVSSTLSSKVAKYTNEAKTHQTSSQNRAAVEDNCPEEYLETRNRLDNKHYVRVKEESKPRLAKWGVNQYGQVNAHFADICELETLSGTSVYTDFVCDYIEASDNYIRNGHQQQFDLKTAKLPKPLGSKGLITTISRETAEQFNDVLDFLHDDIESRQWMDNDLPTNISSI